MGISKHFIMLFLFLSFSCYCQPQSNLDILLEASRQYFEKITTKVSVAECSEISLQLSGHPAAPLLRNSIIHQFSHLRFTDNLDTSPCVLSMSIEKFEVWYYATSSADTVLRIFSLRILPVLRNSNSQLITLPLLDTSFSIPCLRSELPYVEKPSYPFTTAPPPAIPNSSFWKQFWEPILIISSSILAVLLFFTVRSQ